MAAIRLSLTGPAAVSAVRALHYRLGDPDLAVRLYAAQALWAIEKNVDDVLPVLVDLLGVECPKVRVAAAYVLGRMGPRAKAALPVLHHVFATSELLDRLLLAGTISRIDRHDRQAVAILMAGLRDPEADVRYLSAIELCSAPLALHQPITKVLSVATQDGNLRVQAAARDSLALLSARMEMKRVKQTAKRAVSVVALPVDHNLAERMTETRVNAQQALREERDVALEAAHAAAEALAAVPAPAAVDALQETRIAHASELGQSDDEGLAPDAIPPLTDIDMGQAVTLAGNTVRPDDRAAPLDPNEGLKPIGAVTAAILIRGEGQPPVNQFAERYAAEEEERIYLGYGATRGWSQMMFCWDAPAMYFKPLYFEDVNLERYGIHAGCLQPLASFGSFFGRCAFLPYRLLVQPPCECIYTLGYERPNNCIPLYCYSLGYPSLSKWCRTGTCPIGPTCPFESSPNRVCTDDDDCE